MPQEPNPELRQQALQEMLKGNTWTLETDFSLIGTVDDEIQRRLLALGWDEETAIDLMLGVHEGLINAMKHGNKEDISKKVVVNIEISQDKMAVTITDEGDGFNWKDTHQASTADTSGRGIDIYLKPHFDTVEHSDKGNVLTLVRNKVRS